MAIIVAFIDLVPFRLANGTLPDEKVPLFAVTVASTAQIRS